MLVENLGDAAGLTNRVDELAPLHRRSHGRVAHRARPDWRHERTDRKSVGSDQVGDPSQVVDGGVGIGVRMEQEVVDAIEFLAVNAGCGGQCQHFFEADRRFLPRAIPLANEARPHGVVEFGGGMGTAGNGGISGHYFPPPMAGRSAWTSGPKYRRATSGPGPVFTTS